MTRIRWSPYSSGRSRDQIAPADQLVRRGGEAHDPVDEAAAAMPELAQQPHGLHPAKGLLDQFPAPLTDRVTGMARRPSIDRATPPNRVLRDVGRDAHPAHGADPGRHVEVLVA